MEDDDVGDNGVIFIWVMERSKFGVELVFCLFFFVKNGILLFKFVVVIFVITDVLFERIIDGLINCWDEFKFEFGSISFLGFLFCLLIRS